MRPTGDVLLLGTLKEYAALCEKLSCQPWGLKGLGQRIAALVSRLSGVSSVTWEWPDGKRLELGKTTRVMGILNITPDSFSDGGLYLEPDKALKRALAMVEEGLIL